mmetsp:Transcript_4306/g.13587  ORF Transcript_4306/g.13587 Transcript_4306/m.13587 type:complete len:208 (+) Transcript_4306:61-684(+)
MFLDLGCEPCRSRGPPARQTERSEYSPRKVTPLRGTRIRASRVPSALTPGTGRARSEPAAGIAPAHSSSSSSSSSMSANSSNTAIDSLSVNQSVSSSASTRPAGQSNGPKLPASAFATISARPAPAADTITHFAAFITSSEIATKSPSARASLPASTTLPARLALISAESGKRQPTCPSGPVPSSSMSTEGTAPLLSIEACEASKEE